jgi:small subunit ribosomal protein S16
LAVRIRLRRMGKKKMPHYRVVVADIKSPRDGRFIEIIGTYDPHKEPVEINIEEEKALYWLSKGATPSDTVRSLLSKIGVMKKFDEGDASPSVSE